MIKAGTRYIVIVITMLVLAPVCLGQKENKESIVSFTDTIIRNEITTFNAKGTTFKKTVWFYTPPIKETNTCKRKYDLEINVKSKKSYSAEVSEPIYIRLLFRNNSDKVIKINPYMIMGYRERPDRDLYLEIQYNGENYTEYEIGRTTNLFLWNILTNINLYSQMKNWNWNSTLKLYILSLKKEYIR